MDDMTIKKTSNLLGADLSKSFPGALYSPSKKQQMTKKPDPVHHPPPKPLSLLSKTDDDLQPLTWLVSPNLLHNVCGRPVRSDPPRPKRVIRRPSPIATRKSSMVSHFKIKPQTFNQSRNLQPTKKIRAFKIHGGMIKQEPVDPSERTIRHHPYKLMNRTRPNISKQPQATIIKTAKSKYTKPPYSFATLIFMALEEAVGKKLPTKDIYQWIMNKYPYYQLCDRGWKNSVRHNLSLNRCFKRIEKDRRLEFEWGKGCWWTVDPAQRPELYQRFKKLGNINMVVGSENVTPPSSPTYHTPPSSPSVFSPSTLSTINTAEETAAAALCLMKQKPTSSNKRGSGSVTPDYTTTATPSSSESSPEQMPPLESHKKVPARRTSKRSIIIDKKSAEGVWALLEMANSSGPKSK